jgi:exodeoxyribonuclease VII large subunit
MPLSSSEADPAGHDAWPAPAAAARPQAAWEVSALLLAVSDTLSARFGALAVRGELSGFSRAGSGHCYFSLKDAQGEPALLRCAMFRRAAGLLDFSPADGHQVELRGRLALYEPRGDLQFIVEAMRRLGAGTLYEEFLKLRDRLQRLGLFDPARKRELPEHPACIGVVTSLGAAALRDVLTALKRRSPQVRAIVYPCLVQGAEAPASIVAALQQAYLRAEVDTLLLVRGGGSLEDLWAFNDERVVRAVVASPVPLVCGVGHETDITLADLAADVRAATPTAAAELAAPEQADALLRLARWERALRLAAGRQLDRQAQRLDLLARRAGQPVSRVLAQQHRLDGLQQRLGHAVLTARRLAEGRLSAVGERLLRARQVRSSRASERLQALAARLEAAHPDHVLKRGFARIEDATGRPLTRLADLTLGQGIQAVFRDGRADATVTGLLPGPSSGAAQEA